MALRKIEHLYQGQCHCGAHASRHRWRLIGAVGIIGVFAMAAVGHDDRSQAATVATSVVTPAPSVAATPVSAQASGSDAYPVSGRNYTPASPASTERDGGCNTAHVAGTPNACGTN